jgi:adenosylcobinamide-phosphate synthase
MHITLIGLGVAFLIDILLGDPPNRFHPVIAMGSLIRFAQKRYNTGSTQKRFLAGLLIVVIGGAVFSLPWLIIVPLIYKLPVWAAGLLMGCLLKPVFSFRNLIKAGKEVENSLKANNIIEARRLVAWHLVSRDTRQLSKNQIVSAVIESLAENITDSFFAPLLFFSIGGLPAAWFYRFVNTADSMIAYHTLELEFFGKTAAKLDDVLNWLPARLAGIVLVVAAGLSGLNMNSAWRTMKTQNRRTSSPNAGWTMAAAAGALEIVLEKIGNYRLEGGPNLPDVKSIDLSYRLVILGMILCLIICGGTLFVIQTIL